MAKKVIIEQKVDEATNQIYWEETEVDVVDDEEGAPNG